MKIIIKGKQGEGKTSIAGIIFHALSPNYKISVIDGEDEYDNLAYIGIAETEIPQIEIVTKSA